MAKYWYIGWAEYGRLADSLSVRIKSSGSEFDLVIGIARGGVPLAMVIADRIGVKMDMINVKSYTGIGRRVKPKILSTLMDGVKGRRILLVDDLVDHGETMKMLTEYLGAMRPSVLGTATLLKKPWSTFSPDYCLKTVDTWVVFPWEKEEARRLRKR